MFREGGDRYFEHARMVTIIVMDYLFVTDADIIIAALLHDHNEDLPHWPINRIRAEFGDRVALLVQYLSKPSKKKVPNKVARADMYHRSFGVAPRDFFLIKLADRIHNLLTLWDCTLDKRIRKVEETREYYLPWAQKHAILAHEILAALEELEKENG